MPSPIVAGTGFSPDILSFLRLLARKRVRYLIVGGEAVIYHGYPRVTGDVDFFYERSAANARRLYAVLLEFWEDRIPGIQSVDDLLEKGVIFQFGRPPHRIDLMNSIDGVRFQRAWPARLRVQVQTKAGLVPALYMDARSLLVNKESTGRPKDLEDATFLRANLKRRRRRI